MKNLIEVVVDTPDKDCCNHIEPFADVVGLVRRKALKLNRETIKIDESGIINKEDHGKIVEHDVANLEEVLEAESADKDGKADGSFLPFPPFTHSPLQKLSTDIRFPDLRTEN